MAQAAVSTLAPNMDSAVGGADEAVVLCSPAAWPPQRRHAAKADSRIHGAMLVLR